MRFLIISALSGLILSGCASYHGTSTGSSPKPSASKVVKQKPVSTAVSEVKKEITSGVVFELLSENPITLQFTNVDDESYMTVVVDKGLSKNSFPIGHWELTGFEESGNSFLSMNTTKKFILRSKEKSLNYGGTILIGCPSISTANFKLLKQMKFFNRYPFSGSSGLCELVIGDNFAEVRKELKKTQKSKQLKLIMGF